MQTQKHNTCITFVQSRPNIVQMLYKYFVFTGEKDCRNWRIKTGHLLVQNRHSSGDDRGQLLFRSGAVLLRLVNWEFRDQIPARLPLFTYSVFQYVQSSEECIAVNIFGASLCHDIHKIRDTGSY